MGKLKDQFEQMPEQAKDQLQSLFENFPANLEQTISIKTCPAQQTLVRVQDTADFIYLLLDGRVRGVNEQANGAMYAFARFNAPYFFGEFEVFAGCERYRSTLICEIDCKLALIPRQIYKAWVRRDPEALYKRTCQITRDLMQQARIERNYLFYSSNERLLSYLTTHYRRHSYQGICRLRATHQEIADNIGFCTKTVQRNLTNLRKQNLIEQQGRSLVINEAQYKRMLELCTPQLDENTELEIFTNGEY
jgi:CRP/FNR family cyclic AMP-dependent transcriptional regulator